MGVVGCADFTLMPRHFLVAIPLSHMDQLLRTLHSLCRGQIAFLLAFFDFVHPARQPRPFFETILCIPERSGGASVRRWEDSERHHVYSPWHGLSPRHDGRGRGYFTSRTRRFPLRSRQRGWRLYGYLRSLLNEKRSRGFLTFLT
jgi:hypothetical protein